MAKIKKNFGFDKMFIKGVLNSGASVEFTVNRGGERLVAALSNNTTIAEVQIKSLQEWLKFREGECNEQRFERLERLLMASNDSASLINNMSKF